MSKNSDQIEQKEIKSIESTQANSDLYEIKDIKNLLESKKDTNPHKNQEKTKKLYSIPITTPIKKKSARKTTCHKSNASFTDTKESAVVPNRNKTHEVDYNNLKNEDRSINCLSKIDDVVKVGNKDEIEGRCSDANEKNLNTDVQKIENDTIKLDKRKYLPKNKIKKIYPELQSSEDNHSDINQEIKLINIMKDNQNRKEKKDDDSNNDSFLGESDTSIEISCDKSNSLKVSYEHEEKRKRNSGNVTYTNKRRPTNFWTEEEVRYLKEGVERNLQWKEILMKYKFNNRIAPDLKDKWRLLNKTSSSQKAKKKEFVLLDNNNCIVLDEMKRMRVYKEKWPVEAANKIAKELDMKNGEILRISGKEDQSNIHIYEVVKETGIIKVKPKQIIRE